MNANKRSPALYAATGILAAFIGAVVWIVAVSSDPTWIFGESLITDLATSDVELSADLFKYGSIVLGVLILIFSLGKGYTSGNIASAVLFALAGLSLVSAGVNVNDLSYSHIWIIFIELALAVIASIYEDWNAGKRVLTAISAVIALSVIGAAVGCNTACMESIVFIGILVWTLAQSASMIIDLTKE